MRKHFENFNAFLVVLMFLTIFIQIMARLVFRVPTAWSVETSIILFVFVVFLGIACITRERTHLRVDALYLLFPDWFKRVVDVVCGLAYIAFFLVFAYGTWNNIIDNWSVEIPTIEWCKWGYVYLFMFAATGVNLVYLVLNLVEDVTGRAPRPQPQENGE